MAATPLNYPDTLKITFTSPFLTVTAATPKDSDSNHLIKFDPESGEAYISVPEGRVSSGKLLKCGKTVAAYLDAHGALSRLAQANPTAHGLVPCEVAKYQTRTTLQNEHTRKRAYMDFDSYLGEEVPPPSGNIHPAWLYTGYGWFPPDPDETDIYIRPTTHAGDDHEDGWEVVRPNDSHRFSVAWHEIDKLQELMSAVADRSIKERFLDYHRNNPRDRYGNFIQFDFIAKMNERASAEVEARANWNSSATPPPAVDAAILAAATATRLKVRGQGGNDKGTAYHTVQVSNQVYGFDAILAPSGHDAARKIWVNRSGISGKRAQAFQDALLAELAKIGDVYVMVAGLESTTDARPHRHFLVTSNPSHVAEHKDAYFWPGGPEPHVLSS